MFDSIKRVCFPYQDLAFLFSIATDVVKGLFGKELKRSYCRGGAQNVQLYSNTSSILQLNVINVGEVLRKLV